MSLEKEQDIEQNDVPEGQAAEPAGGDSASLQQELEAAKAQAAEYLDGWQRARAEFANYKRRVEKEQSDTYQNAVGRIIARYLDVQDDFDRAMRDRPAEAEAARWAEGVALIYRKLQDLLEKEGVTPIEADGQEFNPQLHEAVTYEDSPDHSTGQVIGVVRKGYRIGDRVIRPALVRVAK